MCLGRTQTRPDIWSSRLEASGKSRWSLANSTLATEAPPPPPKSAPLCTPRLPPGPLNTERISSPLPQLIPNLPEASGPRAPGRPPCSVMSLPLSLSN